MTASVNGIGRNNWRRKWRRVPAERRSAAAESLGDMFRRRRDIGWTPLVLLASLAAHAPAVAVLGRPTGGLNIEQAAQEQTYLKKVMAKERATLVTHEVGSKLTMPPPPPDPEAVVKNTLTADITTDIDRVIGETLDVEVRSELMAGVTADLRTELEAASKQIAEGKLSQKDIRKLQEHFKRQAHSKTVRALRKHREDTQVERAKVSVNEWYENRVSKTLRDRIKSELFTKHGHLWPGAYSYHRNWGFISGQQFERKVQQLGTLVSGQHNRGDLGGKPLQYGWRLLPDWPKASADQAAAIAALLDDILEQSQWSPPWNYGVNLYLDSYYPHRREELIETAIKPMSGLWKQAFDLTETYQTKAEGTDQAAAEAARKKCLAAVAALRDAAAKLVVPSKRRGQYAAVNQAVRSRVLRGAPKDEAYKHFVDSLVEVLAPAVRDMAENEFGEGIIIRQEGIDGQAKQLAEEILAYLRRDIRETFSKARFEARAFDAGGNPYRSDVTGKSCPPDAKDIAADEAALKKVLTAWETKDRAYVQKRAEVIALDLKTAVDRVSRGLVERLTEEGRMRRDFYSAIESVDYADPVAERLDARARALAGRGQDMAKLTDDGVPDTSAPMIALMLGASKGHGASLQPVMTTMVPAHVRGGGSTGAALRPAPPRFPPPPTRWAMQTQPHVRPTFDSPKFEAIPFLANFPRLDGDLSDWGRIRPLLLKKPNPRWPGPDDPLRLYAAWNYQGFFFGYHTDEPARNYFYPQMWYRHKDITGVVLEQAQDTGWLYTGDYLRLLFDTLDARGEWRGEPHTQEFVILPRGTEQNPNIPGAERVIKSIRDAHMRGPWGGHAVDHSKIFLPQPTQDQGPDGTGPYRVTRVETDGYTVEAFLPRTLFRRPVFCPGWYVGFDCVISLGRRPNIWGVSLYGQIWVDYWRRRGHRRKEVPSRWGDLLLLGTDPYMTIQEADPTGTLAQAVVPGFSYLLTVVDPDRNIHLSGEDTVVVSAEGIGGSAVGDVEVFILKETGKNTSVFRGYINTQPGPGRQVQGVVELMPGQELRLGYVDLGNARGERNVVYRLNLPVVAGLGTMLAGR